MEKPTMMLVTAKQEGFDTFQLIRISKDAPYMEGQFNLHNKTFTLLTAESYENIVMIPCIDKDGAMIPIKGQKGAFRQERTRRNKCFDYHLVNQSEVERLVEILTGKKEDLSSYYNFKFPEPAKESSAALSKVE